jgi:hypothetical protein
MCNDSEHSTAHEEAPLPSPPASTSASVFPARRLKGFLIFDRNAHVLYSDFSDPVLHALTWRYAATFIAIQWPLNPFSLNYCAVTVKNLQKPILGSCTLQHEHRLACYLSSTGSLLPFFVRVSLSSLLYAFFCTNDELILLQFHKSLTFVVASSEGESEIYLKCQLFLFYELFVFLWGSNMLKMKNFGAYPFLPSVINDFSLSSQSPHIRRIAALCTAQSVHSKPDQHDQLAMQHAAKLPSEGSRVLVTPRDCLCSQFWSKGI